MPPALLSWAATVASYKSSWGACVLVISSKLANKIIDVIVANISISTKLLISTCESLRLLQIVLNWVLATGPLPDIWISSVVIRLILLFFVCLFVFCRHDARSPLLLSYACHYMGAIQFSEWDMTVEPSIHPFSNLIILTRVTGLLEPIPAVFWQELGDTSQTTQSHVGAI